MGRVENIIFCWIVNTTKLLKNNCLSVINSVSLQSENGCKQGSSLSNILPLLKDKAWAIY